MTVAEQEINMMQDRIVQSFNPVRIIPLCQHPGHG